MSKYGSRSISDSPLEFEITRVNCTYAMDTHPKHLYRALLSLKFSLWHYYGGVFDGNFLQFSIKNIYNGYSLEATAKEATYEYHKICCCFLKAN